MLITTYRLTTAFPSSFSSFYQLPNVCMSYSLISQSLVLIFLLFWSYGQGNVYLPVSLSQRIHITPFLGRIFWLNECAASDHSPSLIQELLWHNLANTVIIHMKLHHSCNLEGLHFVNNKKHYPHDPVIMRLTSVLSPNFTVWCWVTLTQVPSMMPIKHLISMSYMMTHTCTHTHTDTHTLSKNPHREMCAGGKFCLGPL